MVLILEDPKREFGNKHFEGYINFRLQHSFITTLHSIQQGHKDVLNELDAMIQTADFMNKMMTMELCDDCPQKNDCDQRENKTCDDVV